ncbi:hypothetical protein Fot_21905 [Forsythia ovata]|uniref:Uncharacterized protein n=1 Tax=Forsythia ovata TaxID=205694 RepID=A0ABD1UW71_9LAMI
MQGHKHEEKLGKNEKRNRLKKILQQLNGPKSVTGIDGDKEKDGNRVRSAKANKEEHVSSSEWQLTIESKKNREELMLHLILRLVKMCHRSLYQLPSFARRSKENQEAETPGHSVSIKTPEYPSSRLTILPSKDQSISLQVLAPSTSMGLKMDS